MLMRTGRSRLYPVSNSGWYIVPLLQVIRITTQGSIGELDLRWTLISHFALRMSYKKLLSPENGVTNLGGISGP